MKENSLINVNKFWFVTTPIILSQKHNYKWDIMGFLEEADAAVSSKEKNTHCLIKEWLKIILFGRKRKR